MHLVNVLGSMHKYGCMVLRILPDIPNCTHSAKTKWSSYLNKNRPVTLLLYPFLGES